MRKKNFKGRCEKRVIPKCNDVCRTYDPIQSAYADMLAADDAIQEIRCNVPLDGLEVGEYTTDFLCVKADGDLMVRECVFRKHLTKPLTMLNQASGDRQILAKHLNISPHQLSYVTHSGEGEGLLFYGSTILPFVDRFPKDTELYRIMTTKPQEQAAKD